MPNFENDAVILHRLTEVERRVEDFEARISGQESSLADVKSDLREIRQTVTTLREDVMTTIAKHTDRTWKLSNFLKAALTRCGIQASLTRKENEDPSLSARGQKACGYDIFISEHSNAWKGTTRGCEVYLSFRAMHHLKKYFMTRLDNCSALFVTERGPIRRLSRRAIQREIKPIAQRAGITKRVHPHTMRHTFATLTLNNGADLAAVQATSPERRT